MLLREFCLFWDEERFIMRKILSFLVASVLVVGAILFVPSCIKEEYSLKNLDTTVTILPGLSVPLDKEYELPVLKALGTVKNNEDQVLTVDDKGNYRCPCTFNGSTDFRLSAQEFLRTSMYGFNNTELVFPFAGGPMDPLVKSGTYMDSPVILQIDNPTGIDLALGGAVLNENKDYALVTGVKVPAGKSELVLDSEDVKNVFRPLPAMAYVYRFFVQKAITDVPKTASEYVFKVTAEVPLAIMAGGVVEYDYSCDMVKEFGLDKLIDEVDFDFDDIDLELEVENRTPFDVTPVLDQSASEFKGTIEGFKEIAAGAPEKPVITTMNLRVSSIDAKATGMTFHVSASVPASFAPSAALNKQQKVIFRAKSITFNKGITIK